MPVVVKKVFLFEKRKEKKEKKKTQKKKKERRRRKKKRNTRRKKSTWEGMFDKRENMSRATRPFIAGKRNCATNWRTRVVEEIEN